MNAARRASGRTPVINNLPRNCGIILHNYPGSRLAPIAYSDHQLVLPGHRSDPFQGRRCDRPKTVASYLDLLVDLLLVRRLEPWHANVGKRLVKSPRVYVRDSGITHTLLGLTTQEDLLGHPVAGASWEGLVIETLIAAASPGTQSNFYRTSAGAEIDLL